MVDQGGFKDESGIYHAGVFVDLFIISVHVMTLDWPRGGAEMGDTSEV